MANQAETTTQGGDRPAGVTTLVLAWLAVGIPLLWGVYQTLRRALALFE